MESCGHSAQYFTDHYESIPLLAPPEPSDRTRGHGHSSRRGLAELMDEMNAYLMSLSGITPQAIAEKWQKEEEEMQLKAQEESQAKVMEWLQGEIR